MSIEFSFNKGDKQDAVEAAEDEELKICPDCTLPNRPDVDRCKSCNHDFMGEENEWARASEIKQCKGCKRYYNSSRYHECPNCSHETIVGKDDDSSLHRWRIICPKCKTENEPDAKCCKNEKCKKSFEDVDPIDVSAARGESIQITVENFVTRKKRILTIKSDSYILVGREEELGDQLEDCMKVSRLHCLIGILGQNVYIVDLSSNGTFIDGIRAIRGFKTYLQSGVQVILGSSKVSEDKAAGFTITY